MKFLETAAILACMLIVGCASVDTASERIRHAAALDDRLFDAVPDTAFESGRFHASNGMDVPYRLLLPKSARPGVAYPLVVQSHGPGAIGPDNARQLGSLARSWAMPALRQRYPAFVLVPQFPSRTADYGPAGPGQASRPSAALDAAMELVRDFAANRAVDRTRIYAVGFSMGGSAAWLAPSLQPALFAAVVPISGIAPDDALARGYTGLPALVIHGGTDDENPIDADRRFVRAIRAAGGRQVRLREYEGLDHRPPADLYPGLWWRDWLFAQTRRP